MNRERFEQLLDAYGADPSRWPAEERAEAEAFAAARPGQLAEARALDAALEQARSVPDTTALSARILSQAPSAQRPVFDRRGMLALAACAVFGIVLGYGGGLLAPLADEDDRYFADAFAAPFGDEG